MFWFAPAGPCLSDGGQMAAPSHCRVLRLLSCGRILAWRGPLPPQLPQVPICPAAHSSCQKGWTPKMLGVEVDLEEAEAVLKLDRA